MVIVETATCSGTTVCRPTLEYSTGTTLAQPAPTSAKPSSAAGQSGTAEAMTTRRQPNRATSTPDSDIVTTDPVPRHSRRRPSVPSPIAARACANGTNGAQAAMPKPATKNTIRVAMRSGGPAAKCVPSPNQPAPHPRRHLIDHRHSRQDQDDDERHL